MRQIVSQSFLLLNQFRSSKISKAATVAVVIHELNMKHDKFVLEGQTISLLVS